MTKVRALAASLLAIGFLASLTAPSRATTSVSAIAADDSLGPVSVSREVGRTFVDATGAQTVVDDRTVTATVSQTLNLADRQQVTVNWSGAHPTGARVADATGASAPFQEFPFLITECRGVDSPSAPLNPSSCWTYSTTDRYSLSTDTDYPPWRLDHYNSADQRTAEVNVPAGCAAGDARAERYQPFVGVDGTSFPFGPGGPPCGQTPPEVSSNPDAAPLPTNNQFAFTDGRGNGTTSFELRASETYASLGCSLSVQCSIVMVPIEGVSCDATEGGSANDLARCESQGEYAPGELFATSGDRDRPSVTGQEWWSQSNWRNRLSVPVSFRQGGNVCDITDNRVPTDLYGSEILTQATTQWAPYFCLNAAAFKFRHIHLGEPPARALLAQGNISAALVTQPTNEYAVPTISAPLAVGGFGIGFAVDKADGSGLIQSLKLTPRLIAKALTESYPADPGFVQPDDTPLSHNPLNMAADPEFQALNPGLISGTDIDEATILNLSSDSDTEYALTSYITRDPEARAWLDGRPDPWGMVVNPNYKGIQLPVNNWPLSDNFIVPYPKDVAGRPSQFTCYNTNAAPFGNLVAAPTGALSTIAEDVQYVHPTSTLGCNAGDDASTYGLIRSPRETAGVRFMLGLVSIADAQRYGLKVASLQSQVLSNAKAKFSDSTGRVFVSPTEDSLRAAAAEFAPSAAINAWNISYETLATAPAAIAAYPGTLLIYAQVPTRGLPVADASNLAAILRFAAGRGQQPGSGNGDLPPGYLPMTAANGLGGEAAYTLTAADAVAAQSGALPQVVASAGPAPSATTLAGNTSGGTPSKATHKASTSRKATSAGASRTPIVSSSSGTGAKGSAGAGNVEGAGNPSTAPSPTQASVPVVEPAQRQAAGGTANAAAVVRVPGTKSPLATVLLPLTLLILLVSVLFGPALATLKSLRRR